MLIRYFTELQEQALTIENIFIFSRGNKHRCVNNTVAHQYIIVITLSNL